MAALTAKFIEQVKPGPRRQEIPDSGTRGVVGLYFVVQPSGAKSWAIRYRHGGRSRKMTIGRFPLFGLAAAREEAGDLLRAVSKGRDPAAERKEAKAARPSEADRIENVLDDFIERHVEVHNRPKTAAEVKRLIDSRIRPKWSGRQIQDIQRRDIVQLLDGVVDDGAPVTANRVFALLRKLFNWCGERGIVEASPCAGLKAPSKEQSRDRVLTDDELRLVWLGAERMGWPFGRIVQLLILTAQRRDEVASSTWPEFDLEAAEPLWNLGRERVKNNVEHVVPLVPSVVDILKGLKRIKSPEQYVFTTTGESPVSGFSRAKATLDQAMLAIAQEEAEKRGEDPENITITPWRLHDLRRTAASGMAKLGQPIHVVEKILNHQSGSFAGIVGVYQRHNFMDERRRALAVWARHVMGLEDRAGYSNVVPLEGALT